MKLKFYPPPTLRLNAFKNKSGSGLGKIASLFVLSCLMLNLSFAQDCNTLTRVHTGNAPDITTVSGRSGGLTIPPTIQDVANLINPNPDLAASIRTTVLSAGWAYIGVKFSSSFPANTYAGFEISNSSLLNLALGDLEIQLYNGSSHVETQTGDDLLLTLDLLSGGSGERIVIGFVSSAPFDQIRIQRSAVEVGISSLNVYSAVIKELCDLPIPPSCNQNIALTNPTFPVNIDLENTGVGGLLGVNGSVENAEYVIDNIDTNYASISGLTSGTSSLTVIKAFTPFAADSNFVGFDIETGSLLDLGLLSGLTISVMKNGSEVQSQSGSGLLSLNSLLLTGNSRNTIGFVPSVEFDAVKLSVNSTLSVSLGEIRIYKAVVKKFCPAEAPLACNTTSYVTNPEHPVFINAERMNSGGLVAVGADISNTEHVIDSDPLNFASVQLAAGVGNQASISVKNAIETYQAGTFAGFDIQNNSSLLSLDLLGGITISTYLDNILQEQFSGDNLLLGANTSLLNGSNRAVVGYITTEDFDEVVITLNNNTIIADLGTTEIYGAVIQSFCPGAIACNSTYWLTAPDYPVIINYLNTGENGLINTGAVVNPWNVISEDTSDFATLDLTVAVGAEASLSVLDASSVYPVGTIAGFAIQDLNNLAEVALLTDISITTFKNGVEQESASGSELLNLSLITTIIGSGPDIYNVGFVATKEFDEIQINYFGLVGAVKTLNVYGAFVDTRYVNSGVLVCGSGSNPDVAITNISVPVDGDVSTNDDTPEGTVYGHSGDPAESPAGSNPSFTINEDGTYTFVTDDPGVYIYNITVCLPGLPEPCPTEQLKITVLDPDGNNPPVANTDIVNVKEDGTVVIPSLANDRPGTGGAQLDTSSVTIISGPAKGTAVVDPVTGDITYEPNEGATGSDTIVYQVCDEDNVCATAQQRIHILPADAVNTTMASADYFQGVQNKPITGNVSLNDIDPEGDATTVVFLDTLDASQGTLTYAADGSFTFTPNATFTGSLQLRYRTCDDGDPEACATETLNILVDEGYPNLSPVISLRPALAIGATTINVLVSVYEFNNIATNGLITLYILKDPLYTLSFDPNSTTLSGQAVSNDKWTFDNTNPIFYILTTTSIIAPLGSQSIGLSASFNPNGSRGTSSISVDIGSGSGGDRSNEDNFDSDRLIYTP